MRINGISEVFPSDDEKDIQNGYINKIREIYEQAGKTDLYMCINTYGCQMNAHDSEKLQGMLTCMGYKITEDEKMADLILYNTCCIRENAENKMFGHLGNAKVYKKNNKDIKIILCGCMMQQDSVIEKIKKSYNIADVIFGTYNIYKFPELLYANIASGSQIIDVWNEQKEIVEDLPSVRKYPFKAGVNIMYGCNNFCSYCIVPYVRGRERSRASESIINEIKTLAADGVVEVMLLGQNVNSYGLGLDEDITFAELLKKCSEIKGIKRIRFMTSHPKDFSDELIQVIKECDNVCKSVHLPVQSGSTDILNSMNRKYTKESYLRLVDKIKENIPGVLLTTDLIIGFPGERDFDNSETIDVIKKVRYSSAYTFIYSKRNGTPAANMHEQIDETLAKRRFNQVLDVLTPISYEINKTHVGNVYEVLAEDESGEVGLISGRLDNNLLVHFNGDVSYIGRFFNVKITDCKSHYLVGEIIEN
ncbi:MAG: tRNA (N6-isopentenyl adenosine(37)-C2)-methylthiotransferase MiaB [Clostridiales bacterium]|nr:tRNA (N6-isopentenyl adenosine(37)-C2)-methylthiotransferase MiaB [Clostridiales bacterium]